jgi:hypothetical protein
MTFWSTASRLLPQAAPPEAGLNVMYDEQCQPAGPTFCLARVSMLYDSRIQHSVR